MNGKRDIVSRLMNEQIECGGMLYTRKQLFDELIAEGHPSQYVDAFVFGYLKSVQIASSDTEQERKQV